MSRAQTVAERMEAIEQSHSDPFVGFSDRDGPVDCWMDRCSITERAFCGHPKKGSLPPWAMMHPDFVERRNCAFKRLKMEEVRREPCDD